MSAYPKGSTVLALRRNFCLDFLIAGGGTSNQLLSAISQCEDPGLYYEHSIGALSTMFRKLEGEGLAQRDGTRPGYNEIIWRYRKAPV